ncbi:uncharacterized protein LOC120210731 [Hibiscus syriacus]|uniref:uncharacterized protein LOC120210731 n=1 Tax=Hibiscus syriacus TaxID=106335 RepID=UPI001921E634|nr:uncharacterized protein LOC120210731 [Hibiscus syriacus]
MEKISISMLRRKGFNYFKGVLESPSVGSSGGLMSCWDDKVFKLESQSIYRRFIVLSGKFRVNNFNCIFINVYGLSVDEEKDSFFEELSMFISGLIELPLNGGRFTWCNNQDTPTHNGGVNWGKKPFKLFNYLMEEVGFEDLVRSSIQERKNQQRKAGIYSILRNTKTAIKNWAGSRVQFPGANILALESRIHSLELDIQQLQDDVNSGMAAELVSTRIELWRLYKIEEQIWFQKSRSKWIEDGDRNTSFFHNCASIRKRRNALNALNIGGNVIKEPSVIKTIIRYHFFKIFNEHSTLEVEETRLIFPSILVEHNISLEKEFSEEEIWETM